MTCTVLTTNLRKRILQKHIKGNLCVGCGDIEMAKVGNYDYTFQ